MNRERTLAQPPNIANQCIIWGTILDPTGKKMVKYFFFLGMNFQRINQNYFVITDFIIKATSNNFLPPRREV